MNVEQFPSHWKLVPLADALDALIDYRGKTPKKTTHGIPLITAKIVKGGRLLEASEYIAEVDYEKWMVRGLPEVGDVVVTTEAPLGEVAQLENNNVALAQRIVTLRGAKGLLINDYLRYLMQGDYVQSQLESRASGSTVKGIKQSELRKVLLPIPPIPEQEKAATVLKEIDNKIQINQKINQTLECMAQAIFKSWFVDFEPVKAKIAALEAGGSDEDALIAAMRAISGKDAEQLDSMKADKPDQYAELRATADLFPSAMQESELGEIPWGWQVSNIDKTTSLIIDHRGKTPKKLGGDWGETGYVALSAKHIKNGQIVNRDQLRCVNEELYIKWMKEELQKGDILLTSEGPMGEMYYLSSDEKYCLSQRLYALRADVEKINPSFLYHWLNSPLAKGDMEGRATGTTVVGIRQAELRKVKVICPLKPLTDAFGKVAQSSLDTSSLLINESLSLSAIRDSLLPRLLSGELGVEGVE